MLELIKYFDPQEVASDPDDEGDDAATGIFLHPQKSDKAKLCEICLVGCRGQPDYHARRNALGRSRPQCQLCADSVCQEHTVFVCTSCMPNLRRKTTSPDTD